MNMRTFSLIGIMILLLTSCNYITGNNRESKENDKAGTGRVRSDTAAIAVTDLSNLRFASDRDTACGMPLSAGLSDTLVLNGAVYGFCTPACKQLFRELLTTGFKH